MKLEITKNQAEELRTQGGKVLEETRYFAVVAHVAAEAVLPTTVVPPDPPVKKRSKRRRSTRPIVFQRDTLVLRHAKPRFYSNTGIAAQVYDAVRLLFGTPVGANGIVRNKLEQDTVKLLPEYERPVVSKAISALITKKVLARKGD